MHISYLTLTMISFYLQDFQVLFPRIRISQFPLGCTVSISIGGFSTFGAVLHKKSVQLFGRSFFVGRVVVSLVNMFLQPQCVEAHDWLMYISFKMCPCSFACASSLQLQIKILEFWRSSLTRAKCKPWGFSSAPRTGSQIILSIISHFATL